MDASPPYFCTALCSYVRVAYLGRLKEFELLGGGVERETMIGREAVAADGQSVLARGVALILCPAIGRILFGEA